jgi:hypothetical protein
VKEAEMGAACRKHVRDGKYKLTHVLIGVLKG